MFDPKLIQQDFPILQKKVHGKKLVYLDNAATSQKPTQVIDAMVEYYYNHNANVHRGVHTLSDESTQLWHESRKVITDFFSCEDEELILVRNTTEAINGVVYGWALDHLKEGDVVLTTQMDHHSNLVPWQEVCKRVGATLEFVQVNEQGELEVEGLGVRIQRLGSRLKLIVLPHVSNALGTHNPVDEIVSLVHQTLTPKPSPLILIDGAQSAPHIPINFRKLDVDFFIFSGHKMLGPMGVGGLIVKKELLQSEKMKPWLFGGGMIEGVYTDHTDFNPDLVDRFTAGTPDVASTVGLAAACIYLRDLGMEHVEKHDRELVLYAIEKLTEVKQVKIVGPTSQKHQISKSPVYYGTGKNQTISKSEILNSKTNLLPRIGSVTFLYEGVHAHDVAQILDSEGIAVRSGHHCTMPLHTKFNWPATVRASFQVYNTKDDIDALVTGLEKVQQVFGKK